MQIIILFWVQNQSSYILEHIFIFTIGIVLVNLVTVFFNLQKT